MSWKNFAEYSVVDFAVMASLLIVSIGLVVAIVNGLRQLKASSDKSSGAA